MGRVKRIWYLSPMRAAKVQASLRIRAVSPESPLLAHTSSESRGTFRQKARSLVPLNGWACAVTICHDGMLEDINSFDGAHIVLLRRYCLFGFNVAFNIFFFFFWVVSRRCLIATGSSVLTFIVLAHWWIMPKTLGMIPHPVTLSWHWADQS